MTTNDPTLPVLPSRIGIRDIAYLLLLALAVAALSDTAPAWRPSSGAAAVWILAASTLAALRRPGYAILLLALGLFIYAAANGHEEAAHGQCANNLRHISLALFSYESRYGCMPPPYVVDSQGTPLLSWRVLILPDLGHEELYRKIDLSKPWNHPTNLQLANQMPLEYVCPLGKVAKELSRRTTPYVAICGDETIWPRHGVRSREDAAHSDGLTRTICLVQSETSRLHWMAPFDPGIEALASGDPPGESILANNPRRRINVLFCDGSVITLSDSIRLDTMRAMCTMAGGEQVPDSDVR